MSSDVEQSFFVLFTCGLHQVRENTFLGYLSVGVWILTEEFERMVILTVHSILHDQDSIRINHRVKSVSDHKHSCAILGILEELLAQSSLNQIVSDQVNICGSFIQNDDLGFLQQGSCQTDQLLLPHRKNCVIITDFLLQAFWVFHDFVIHLYFFEYIMNLLISFGAKNI